MSKENSLNFTTKDAIFATSLKVLKRNSKSKCWIQVKNTENRLVQHILFQYYRNPNQQINDLVKVAIVNGYNKLIIDSRYRNADGVIDNTLDSCVIYFSFIVACANFIIRLSSSLICPDFNFLNAIL